MAQDGSRVAQDEGSVRFLIYLKIEMAALRCGCRDGEKKKKKTLRILA